MSHVNGDGWKLRTLSASDCVESSILILRLRLRFFFEELVSVRKKGGGQSRQSKDMQVDKLHLESRGATTEAANDVRQGSRSAHGAGAGAKARPTVSRVFPSLSLDW